MPKDILFSLNKLISSIFPRKYYKTFTGEFFYSNILGTYALQLQSLDPCPVSCGISKKCQKYHKDYFKLPRNSKNEIDGGRGDFFI